MVKNSGLYKIIIILKEDNRIVEQLVVNVA